VVNLGGALIPVGVDAYLLPRAPPLPLFIALLGVTAACYAAARPTPGVGTTLPAFVPPLAAAGLALALAPNGAPAIAYIAGTLGALLGADAPHLPEVLHDEQGVLSIGGAGVHDGIFLAGIIAVALT
jgi:uncharacterized membrane protein